MRALLLFLVALSLVGCHRAVRPKADPAPDPDAKLREQLSRGSFDLTAAIKDLEQVRRDLEAVQSKAPKSGEIRETLETVAEGVDGCGAEIADFTSEPPPMPDFKKQIADQRKRLADGLQAANDALHQLDDVWGEVDGILDSPPPGLTDALEDLSASMEAVSDDLKSAIRRMGGTPDSDSDDSDDSDDAGSADGAA